VCAFLCVCACACLCVCVRLSQVQLVPGEAVCEELGALLVLMRHFGLKRLVHLPPHAGHAGPKATLHLQLVALTIHTHTHTHTHRVSSMAAHGPRSDWTSSCVSVQNYGGLKMKHLFIPVFIYLFLYLFMHLLIYSYIYSCIYLFITIFIHAFIYLFILKSF